MNSPKCGGSITGDSFKLDGFIMYCSDLNTYICIVYFIVEKRDIDCKTHAASSAKPVGLQVAFTLLTATFHATIFSLQLTLDSPSNSRAASPLIIVLDKYLS